MADQARVGIIGGGLGGLAAACTLAARGHRVLLLERNPFLGGKAYVLEEAGFRFDMGPTILTLPSVLRRIFAEASVPLETGLQLIGLDPQWRCFFEDGSRLDLVSNVDEMADRETLIFLDADVRLARHALRRITLFLHQSESQLVSGFPHQETGSLAEELIVPLIHFVLLGFLPLGWMRASPHPAYGSGCGQLFATRKSDYRRAGGHAAIRGSLHDGLQLPRAYRRAGMMTDVFDASDIATCRMYRGLGEVWRGFAKNAAEGLAAPATILPVTLLLAFGHVLPPVLILLALPQGLWRPAGLWALAALVASYLPRIALALCFRHPWRGTMLHPLGIALFLGIQWWAWLRARLGYKAGWKGRGYLPD